MTKERKKFQLLTSDDICRLYSLLLKEGLVSFPEAVDSSLKIEALVKNITGASFGKQHYESTEEKIVAYLYFIIKNHAFVDGNKRTASFAFLVLCDINKVSPNFKDFSLDQLAVLIERMKTKDHQKLIKDISKLLF